MLNKNLLIVAFFLTLQALPTKVVLAGWFGPDSFEECVAKEAKKGLGKAALYWVAEDCRKKFPREYRNLTKNELRQMALTNWSWIRREKGKQYDWPGSRVYVARKNDIHIQGYLSNPTKNVHISSVSLECTINPQKIKFEIKSQVFISPRSKVKGGWTGGVPSSFPTQSSSLSCAVFDARGEIK